MPRSTKSASSSRRSKRNTSGLGRRLVAGLNDALAHARGQLELPSYTVRVPEQVDVARLRHRLGLSQAAFAHTFGLDVTALHAWEQGRRRPDRAARVLLAVIAKEPEAVLRALSVSDAPLPRMR
jgi:putative transcriptional regulator